MDDIQIRHNAMDLAVRVSGPSNVIVIAQEIYAFLTAKTAAKKAVRKPRKKAKR